MKKAKIVRAQDNGEKTFSATIKNTRLSQRKTLEEIMVNLASLVGANEIYYRLDSNCSYFYEVKAPGFSCYQSASNTILELSKALYEKFNQSQG